jgi:N-acetylglucosaminyldiphosphoundecaprenol N-acetyl-beta-D-mannosaminyltransferase
MLRLKGVKNQQRVYGPTLMLYVLEMAARDGISVGFYGGEARTLQLLEDRMRATYPSLVISYSYSPPFRPLTEPEALHVTQDIIHSGVQILFVGLGCPRQETWIDAQHGTIPAVMIGIGAAIDFHAGLKPQAPAWMQRIGLEWFFRLSIEPRRLWRRYFLHVPRFIVLAIADLLGLMRRTA